MKYLLSILSIFLFFFTGCDQQNRCYDSVNTEMVVSLKSSDYSVYHTLVAYGVNRNLTGDTLVNDTITGQSKRFALPLSTSADSTGFVFTIGRGTDTIYFHHVMSMQFISEACGFAPKFNLTGISFTRGIDSARITDRIVNTQSIQKNVNDQNVAVYFNSALH